MNEAELQKATGDIYYEAQMLYRAYSEHWRHESFSRRRVPEWTHNCIIEATLVHTRALLEFFECSRTAATKGRRPYPDDVLAEDYGFPVTPLSLPAELRKRINTSITHLSYRRTRIPEDERHWDFIGFIPLILSRAADFFAHLLATAHPRSSYPGDSELQQFIADTKGQQRLSNNRQRGCF